VLGEGNAAVSNAAQVTLTKSRTSGHTDLTITGLLMPLTLLAFSIEAEPNQFHNAPANAEHKNNAHFDEAEPG